MSVADALREVFGTEPVGVAPSSRRREIVIAALRKGETDDRLLSGRDFSPRYWQNARRQLTVLLRELDVACRERDALRSVIDAQDDLT